MKDIELVIKIDEEQYEFIRQNMTRDKVKDYHALLYDICKHIANGTPLPKGHGDLIDRNSILCTDLPCDLCGHTDECFKLLAPTIIEKDGD